MIKKFLLFVFLPLHIIVAQDQDQIALANEYFMQGEMEKAKTIYEELVEQPVNVQYVASNYLSLLKSMEEYKQVENFLLKSIKTFPNELHYQANLAGFYNMQNDKDKLEKYINTLKKNSAGNPFHQQMLAQNLANEQLYQQSIIFFKEARKTRGSDSYYALELASIYRIVNEKPAMIQEYLNYASESPNRLNYVQNLLQSMMQEEGDLEELELNLIQKMQESPDNTMYSELLIWVELQRKNFYGAFIQARAIDKRNSKPGDRTMEIGQIALDNKSYDDAIDVFEYVINQFPDSRNYSSARKLWIESKEQKIKSTYPVDQLEIRALANQYFDLYTELQPEHTAFEALRSKALLHAFYLNEIDSASFYLNQLVSNRRVSLMLVSQGKLDLGDIYLLKGEPWEASLLYSQVEKAHKNHPLSYDAKLRNARLNYFTGNFALAKGHLDILKKNTTREISNDAISLGMLITDNTALDTTDQVMQEFANIELLIFQNKKREAELRLLSMLELYERHSVTDEIYWLLAKLELEFGEAHQAITYLDKILTSYSYDILADDAAFKKAEIYDFQIKDVEQAKALYQQFLIEYPGSMFAAEARKRFRLLRGDFVN
jgi:predicted Zn-dependent protease